MILPVDLPNLIIPYALRPVPAKTRRVRVSRRAGCSVRLPLALDDTDDIQVITCTVQLLCSWGLVSRCPVQEQWRAVIFKMEGCSQGAATR